MVRENLEYIEIQCRRAVRVQLSKLPSTHSEEFDILIENESLELSNRVLDKLKEKDFQILRQFQGKSKLTTYLSAIISRQAVDMVREKKGRIREKERAAAMGKIGEKVYNIVFRQGLSIVEVQKDFLHRGLPVPTDGVLLEAIDKIKGSAGIPSDGNDIKKGFLSSVDGGGESFEIVVPDTGSNPEKLFIDTKKREEVERVFGDLMDGLSGEERLILRMRFGFDEEDTPKKIPEIASVLNIDEKAVYKRIGNILAKCRKTLSLQGVDINELF